EFPVHVTISGIKNEEGVLIGGTYVFGDLTEQVKIGTEMRRLAATIESVSDLIIIADLENKIVYTNPAALQRFGYTSDEMLGQAASIVVPPEQKEIARELAIKTRTEGHWSGEVVNITKTGDRLHVLLNTAVVRDSNGEILALVGMGKDITNLKQAEEQIRTYATELEKVNETLRSTQQQLVQSEKQAALGILASGIAHEIGNPLASISSLIQLATRRTNDTNVQGTMSQVATHVERISKIIRSLVDLARATPGEKQPVCVETLLKNAVKISSFSKPQCKIIVETEIEENLPPVEGSPADLLQAIVNVVVNSIDAVKDLNGKISIIGRRGDGGVIIEIVDNGVGIASEDHKKLFQPFFTTKEVGAGEGLGLSVTYNIVKNVGGHIDISSKKGEGTRVSIFLPTLKKESGHEHVSHTYH
ncbi:MAG TPA: PAS domain S-box protein, partial [Bdellovibrionota bacterium]|nr:PAS domain S-box protein [Bdellovibrionota bacterium]